jgi:hypothetical protein
MKAGLPAIAQEGSVWRCFPEGRLNVWDAQTDQILFSIKGHTREVWSVTFSSDGKRLASDSVDKTIKVWDAQTGLELGCGHRDVTPGMESAPGPRQPAGNLCRWEGSPNARGDDGPDLGCG